LAGQSSLYFRQERDWWAYVVGEGRVRELLPLTERIIYQERKGLHDVLMKGGGPEVVERLSSQGNSYRSTSKKGCFFFRGKEEGGMALLLGENGHFLS